MDSAAVSKLKASLSKYLKRVKEGEEILVTERGNPVAKLVPVTRGTSPLHLREMERQGLVRLGPGRLPKSFFSLPQPADEKGMGLKALLDERRAGR